MKIILFYFISIGGIHLGKKNNQSNKKRLWIIFVILFIAVIIPVLIIFNQNSDTIAITDGTKKTDENVEINDEENVTEEELKEYQHELYKISQELILLSNDEREERIVELIDKIGWTKQEYVKLYNNALELREKSKNEDISPNNKRKIKKNLEKALKEIGLTEGEIRRLEAEAKIGATKGENVDFSVAEQQSNMTPGEKFEYIKENLTEKDIERHEAYTKDKEVYEETLSWLRSEMNEVWKNANGFKRIKLPDGVEEITLDENRILFTELKGTPSNPNRELIPEEFLGGPDLTIYSMVKFIFEDGKEEDVLVESLALDTDLLPNIEEDDGDFPRITILGVTKDANVEHQIEGWKGFENRFILTDWMD